MPPFLMFNVQPRERERERGKVAKHWASPLRREAEWRKERRCGEGVRKRKGGRRAERCSGDWEKRTELR